MSHLSIRVRRWSILIFGATFGMAPVMCTPMPGNVAENADDTSERSSAPVNPTYKPRGATDDGAQASNDVSRETALLDVADDPGAAGTLNGIDAGAGCAIGSGSAVSAGFERGMSVRERFEYIHAQIEPGIETGVSAFIDANDILQVSGTAGSDSIGLRLQAGNPSIIEVRVPFTGTGSVTPFFVSDIVAINVNTGLGADFVVLDDSQGEVGTLVPTTIDTGGELDVVVGRTGSLTVDDVLDLLDIAQTAGDLADDANAIHLLAGSIQVTTGGGNLIDNAALLVDQARTSFVEPGANYISDVNDQLIQIGAQRVIDIRDQLIAAATDLTQDAHFDLSEPGQQLMNDAENQLMADAQALADDAQNNLEASATLLIDRASQEFADTEAMMFMQTVEDLTNQIVALADMCPDEPDEPPKAILFCPEPTAQELVDCLETEIKRFACLAELCEFEADGVANLGDDVVADGEALDALGGDIILHGDSMVADAEAFVITANNLLAMSELFVAQLEMELGSTADAFDTRADTDFIGPGAALETQAATDVVALASTLEADASQLEQDAEQIVQMISAILSDPIVVGGGGACAGIITTNTIIGGSGADVLLGTTANDRIEGQDGLDLLIGAPGDDILIGGPGVDIIFGGPGTNDIQGGDALDILIGGNDVDCIAGEAGLDLLFGREGDDELDGGLDIDLLIAGPGDDTGDGNDGIDVIFGGPGNDDMRGGNCIDVVFGGDGDDTVVGNAGQLLSIGTVSLDLGDVLFGGIGDDDMFGDEDDGTGDGIDVMFGQDGMDEMFGGNGGDFTAGSFTLKIGNVMFGGAGNDTIDSRDGICVLFGGTEDDTITAGIGDTISFSSGSFMLEFGDIIFGNPGNDTINGDDPGGTERDIDLIFAGTGDDVVNAFDGGNITIGSFQLMLGNLVFGRDGDDNITAEDGIDLIFGGNDNDTIQAGDGAIITVSSGSFMINFGDLLFGGTGNDVIHGDAPADPGDGMDDGIDIIFGGTGDDQVYSGSGGLVDFGGTVQFTFGALIFGNPGNDTLIADYLVPTVPEEGIDLIFGAAGDDIINGGPGSTIQIGTSPNQVLIDFGGLLFGGVDNDTIDGGDDMDLVFCGRGDDTARTFDGIDLAFGSPGEDNIIGEDGGQIIIPIMGVPTPIPLGNIFFGGDDNDRITSEGRLLIDIDLLFGNECDDIIRAGSGLLDLNFGNRGNDTIFGEESFDLTFGNRGDDTIDAGPGIFDLTFGNRGDDTIRGNNGPDLIFGNSGADDIDGGNGLIDLLFGNTEPDIIRGGAGLNIMFGNRGGDLIIGGGGLDIAFGNRGNDDIDGGPGLDILFGNRDNDVVNGNDGLDLVFGNRGNDDVLGGNGLDLLFGGDNDDWLFGQNDLDLMFGGAGADKLFGGPGTGLFFGGSGNDILIGDTALDLLFGGRNNDWIAAGGGTDIAFGNRDNDTISGQGGTDFLFGNRGNDDIDGGPGRDFVFGNRGEDRLLSNTGRDFMFGNRDNDFLRSGSDGSERDYLFGNRHDDILHGCNNDDKLYGGLGSDTKDQDNCANFTFAGPGNCASISGTVRQDIDGNGSGDVGMPGVTVYLDLNNNGVLNGGEPTTVTINDNPDTHEDEAGFYQFTNLAPGNYVVRQVVPVGLVQTSPAGGHSVGLGNFTRATGRDFVNFDNCTPVENAAGILSCEMCECQQGFEPVLVEVIEMRCPDGSPCQSDGECSCGGCVPMVVDRRCECRPIQGGACSHGEPAYVGQGGIIPDSTGGPGVPLTTAISVPDSFLITHVSVSLNGLDHTRVGDLSAVVTSPMGTNATLFFRVGRFGSGTGDTSAYCGVYGFDTRSMRDLWAEAQSTLADLCVASDCYFPTDPDSAQPNNSLAAFNGENANGKWVLRIVDHARLFDGALQSWTLNFNGVLLEPEGAAVPRKVTVMLSSGSDDEVPGPVEVIPDAEGLAPDTTSSLEGAVEDPVPAQVEPLIDLGAGPPNDPLRANEVRRNRYVAFVPNNERVVAFSILIPPCRTAWIDRPQLLSYNGRDFAWVANVVDNPVYRVWTEEVVHVRGCVIIPERDYRIAAVDRAARFSNDLTVATVTPWGDVAGPQNGGVFSPPDGVVNQLDIRAIRAAINGDPNAPPVMWVDLAPISPDYVPDQQDLQAVQSALSGIAYPPDEFGIRDIVQCNLADVCNATCGDSNCDGVVTVGDINFFVSAVVQGEPAWSALFPGEDPPCDFVCANDTNGDGLVSVGDINAFVAAVVSGVPCGFDPTVP